MPVDAFGTDPDDEDMADWIKNSVLALLDKNDGWDIVEAARISIPDAAWLSNLKSKVGFRDESIEKQLRRNSW